MYVYPWDVIDQGAESLSDELAEIGIRTLSIASSYHAGHFVQPRGKRRRTYFPEDGVVYFEPSSRLWQNAEISPRPAAQLAEGNALRDLIVLRDRGGLAVSCWTVCLHNTRLGLRHPGHVTRNAFGDPNVYSLCPSSPAARQYARHLVSDLVTQFGPDCIEIETPGFMRFTHGYHHEKDGLGLTAKQEFLLSICFCEHCRTRAAAQHVDAENAASSVRRILDAAFATETPAHDDGEFGEVGYAALDNASGLSAYLALRGRTVSTLIGELRDEIAGRSRLMIITEPQSWREGIDLAAASLASDGIATLGYGQTPKELAAMLAGMRELIGPAKELAVALRPFVPEISQAPAFTDLAVAAVQGGASRLHFYNYGLIPASRLKWIAAAVQAATVPS
ncbi:MAG: hypothetical protein ABIQ30_08965 [Devosia sp.]